MLKQKVNADKILSFFSAIPLTPNQVTILSVLIAIAAFFTFSYSPLISIILFALSFFVDAIDGVIARAKNLASKQGAFLDGISDRVVEFMIILTILAFISHDINTILALVSILFFGTCMTSFVKAYAHHQSVLTEEKAKKLPGLLERAERVFLLFIALVLYVYFPGYAFYVICLTAILSFITFIQRLWIVLKE